MKMKIKQHRIEGNGTYPIIRNIKVSFWILLLIFFQFHVNANSNEFKFERYSTDAGLSNNYCLSILQDYSGYLWIGTAEGLNKFDGYNFEIHSSDNFDPKTISHSLIFSLLEDRERKLWVGTWGGGINIYNREKNEFEHIRHFENDPDSLRSDNVMTMVEDNNGFIWVGSDGGA